MIFDLFSARETPTMPRVTYGLLGVSSMRWPVYKKPLRVPISRLWCTRLCRFVIGSLQLCSNVLMMSRWCHFLLCHYYTSRFPLRRWRETTVMDWSSWWVDANIPTCLVPSRFHFIHPPWPPPSFSPSFFPPFLPSSLPPLFLPSSSSSLSSPHLCTDWRHAPEGSQVTSQCQWHLWHKASSAEEEFSLEGQPCNSLQWWWCYDISKVCLCG